MQRRTAGLVQQVFEHHVLAPPLGEVRTVFFAQRRATGVAVLLIKAPTLVAMATIEAPSGLCYASLLERSDKMHFTIGALGEIQTPDPQVRSFKIPRFRKFCHTPS